MRNSAFILLGTVVQRISLMRGMERGN